MMLNQEGGGWIFICYNNSIPSGLKTLGQSFAKINYLT